jgi:hypothetical protein
VDAIRAFPSGCPLLCRRACGSGRRDGGTCVRGDALVGWLKNTGLLRMHGDVCVLLIASYIHERPLRAGSALLPGVEPGRVRPVAGKSVRYRADDGCLRVEDVGDAALMDSTYVFASLDVLGPAGLASLKAAMTAVNKDYGYRNDDDSLAGLPRFRVTWTLDEAAEFDDDLSMAEPVSLALMRDGSLLVELDWAFGPAPRTEADTWPEGAALLDNWLQSRGGRLISLSPGSGGFRWYWTTRFSVPVRGRTVADVHAIGTDAISLLESHGEGVATIESLTALLQAGHAGALVGMNESQLLEAKRHLHLEDDKARLELAKDVSAIANSSGGGLLVVGLATRRESGRDVVTGVHPFPDTGQVRRVRAVLDRLVYPPIEGLDVSMVPAGLSHLPEDYLLLITVPPQPREMRPFLVTGVVLNDRVRGSYIGLFERRGEDVVASSPASIHAGLSVGLALMRGQFNVTEVLGAPPAQPGSQAGGG